MITRAEVRQILTDVQANLRLLAACPGPHDFVCLRPENPLGAKYRCSVCHGSARGDAVHWYQAGLAHGKKASA